MKSIENSYQIDYTRIYGSGAYGTVYKCVDVKDKEKKLCVKIVNYNQYEQQKFVRELKVMNAIIDDGIKNPNIVKVEMATEEKGLLYFVMEKCDEELKQYLENREKQNKAMKLSEALDCIRQIMNGYKVIYEYGLMHRDIKPENILIRFNDDAQPIYKIADFGMAKLYKSYDKSEQTVKGTPIWASPQVFQGQNYTSKTDIYSLGLLFYFIIFGSLPYGPFGNIKNRRQLFEIQGGFKLNPFKVDFSSIKERVDIEPQKQQQLAQLIESMIRYEEYERIQFTNLFSHSLISIQAEIRLDVDEDLFKTALPQKQIQQNNHVQTISQIKPIVGQNIGGIKQVQPLLPQPNSIQKNQLIQQNSQPILTPMNSLQPQIISNIQFPKPQSQIQQVNPINQQQQIQQNIQQQQFQNQNQQSPLLIQNINGQIQQNALIPKGKIQIVIKKNLETILLENFERFISINTKAEKTVLDFIYICSTYFLKRQPMNSGHYQVKIQQLKEKYQDDRDLSYNNLSLIELTKSVQQLYKQNIQLFPYKQKRMYYQEYIRMICFLEYIINSLPIDKLIQDALDYSCDPQEDIINIINYIQVQRTS